MAIDTHFQQNLVDLTFFVGTVTRLSIPQSSLTNGDRYIALWKGLVGQAGGRTRLQLRIDGTLVTGQRGTRAAAFAGARTKQISGFHVFTAGSTGNVEVEAVNVTSNSNTRDEHLLLINLDDAMVENTDWFLNVNTTNDSTHGSSYGSENDKASITFTPDGVSDYLVIGNLKWAFTNDDDETWRIRDQTAAVTLVQTGPGGGNIGNEDANDVLMHVLQAPAAVPKTIDTEYKSFPVSIKDDARLFILRLNVFSSFGFVQTDLNATPTGARQSIGSTSVTPDANGEVIILSSLLGEVTPGFESGLGYGGDIEYNSSIVFAATTPSASRNISASGGPTKAEAWVGPAFFGKLTGQPVSSTPVEGFIDAFNNNGFQHTLRTQTVVAFSTELFITPPPGGISDQAGNPLAPTTVGSMIGFIEPPATSELLPLDMYDFLIFPIRDLDFKKGDLFVKRFLRGSQQIWRDTQTTIFGIKDLLSVQDCPDEFLQFLKNLVGWTSDPITERITRDLDFDTLRRLIDASVPLWKTRGPEDTVINFWRNDRGEIFNEIRVGDVVVQSKVLKQFKDKDIPVKIGAVGVQEKSSRDWQMRWGESFIAANRQMYDHENTIWSLLAEIMRTQSFPNLLNITRSGSASVRTEDVRGHGQVIPLKQGDTLDLLRNAAAPSEVFQLLDMIRVQKQKGSLPDIVFGSVPVELSGFAIAQLMAAIRFKVAPYLEVKDATMGDITTSLLEQYRDGDGTKAFPPVTLMTVDPKALRKGEFYVEDFKPSDVPDTTFVEVDTPITSALDKTQQIIFARQALEQPQLLSRETLWDGILEVQDAEQEKVRIAEDMLESNPLMQQLAILEAMQRKAEKLREAGMPTKAAIVEREIQQIELNLGLRQGILQQPGGGAGVPPNVLPPEMAGAPDLGIVPPGPVNRQPQGQEGRIVTPGNAGR